MARRFRSRTAVAESDGVRPPAAVARARTFAALAVPKYGRLWASGALWNLTRWMGVFLCSYLVNEFYFTFTPLVPVFADRLAVNAFWTGVLASASGLGSLLASLAIAARSPRGKGLIYVAGSTVAMAFLLVFAAAHWYPLAVTALFLSGTGMAGFTTMQAMLVMSTSTPAMRGRAMGILSMAIGTLPFAMALLGVVAQRAGAPAAVFGSAALGIGAMLLWNAWRPEARRLA